jgi:hypothetical protein
MCVKLAMVGSRGCPVYSIIVIEVLLLLHYTIAANAVRSMLQ